MTVNHIRADTTFIGYLLIGFIFLMLGVLGLQNGCLFGDIMTPEGHHNAPVDGLVFAIVNGVVGVILVILAVFAYRTGNKSTAGIFMFFGIVFIFAFCDNYRGIAIDTGSDWFLYLAMAIFFLVTAVNSFIDRSPKFVTLLILISAVVFLFCSLTAFYFVQGDEIFKAMSIIYGIISLIGFVVATYLCRAYANPKRIPLI